MASNEYSHADMMAMQRDAVRRVNEMQRIAKEKVSAANGAENERDDHRQSDRININRPSHNEPQQSGAGIHRQNENGNMHEMRHENEHPENRHHENNEKGIQDEGFAAQLPLPFDLNGKIGAPLKGFLDKMDLDQETLSLIMLLLMLVNDGADTMLVLALVYILL